MASGTEQHSPMDQFKIAKYGEFELFGLDLSFTNSAAFMVAAVVITVALLFAATARGSMIPGRIQSLGELSVIFIRDLMRDTIGPNGRPFLPLVYSLFMFVLLGNLLGMVPYSFTFTSHIIVTFVMALFVFVLVTVVALYKHGMHFFSFFAPSGVPKVMLLLLIPIEVISYFSRPISLAVRLFANMLAGHTLVKVIATFVPMLGLFGVLPLALISALTGLEILIAFLQAYVFAILTCLYINDALHLH